MSEISEITTSSYIGQTQYTEESSDDMGQDEFLYLLTVQLQNQDPMSPMESMDFSSQLAQFSQLEQLEEMSESLTQSNEIDLMLTQAITNTMSTTLVGNRAKVYGDEVMFDSDGNAEVTFNLASTASDVEITIKDEDGNIVQTLEEGGMVDGLHTVEWDGTDSDGNALDPDETYTFEVDATDSDGNSITVEQYMVGVVQGIDFSDSSTSLILNNGQTTAFSSVIEILAPEDSSDE